MARRRQKIWSSLQFLLQGKARLLLIDADEVADELILLIMTFDSSEVVTVFKNDYFLKIRTYFFKIPFIDPQDLIIIHQILSLAKLGSSFCRKQINIDKTQPNQLEFLQYADLRFFQIA